MRYMKNKDGKVFEITDMDTFYNTHPDEFLRPSSYTEFEEQEKEKRQKLKELEKELEEKRKNREKTIKDIKVGDILHTSWGYDQTNNDYCVVIGKTAKSLLCQMIGMRTVKQTGYLSELVVPNPDSKYGKAFRVFQRSYTMGDSERVFFVGSYPYCEGLDSKRKGSWDCWDGEPDSETHYH